MKNFNNILKLLTWNNQSFPIGSYCFSSGLEYAVETRVVDSANELKKSLLSLASESDAELDLQPLYDSDIRIKMDWTYFN